MAGLKYHRTHHSDNPSTQLVTPPPITAKGVGEAKQQPQQPPLSCICPPVYNQPPRIRCGLTLKGTGPLKKVAGIEKAGPYRKLVFLRNPKALKGTPFSEAKRDQRTGCWMISKGAWGGDWSHRSRWGIRLCEGKPGGRKGAGC